MNKTFKVIINSNQKQSSDFENGFLSIIHTQFKTVTRTFYFCIECFTIKIAEIIIVVVEEI